MPKKGSPAPVRMEAVEARRLLSAAVDHGVLNIQGTRRGDDIAVTLASPRTIQVVMNGEVSTFARRSIGKLRILGNDGDDFITFGSEVTGPAWISGGGGNDNISGTAGNDTINGDDGADRLNGNGGRDLIHGGAGNDNLWGDDGDDQLFGDSGADNLSGGEGDDTLLGGRGGDTLYEDAGRDRLYGNADRDTFYFSDSPKDIRDETRDETIAPQPPPVDLSYHGTIDIGSLVANPIKGWGGGSGSLNLGGSTGGIITNSGGSQGGGGGIVGNGGSITISSGGHHGPTTPILASDPSAISLRYGELTYVYRDVPPGQSLFLMSGGTLSINQASLLDRLRSVSVEGGGLLADGATLDVPAGTVIAGGDDGSEQNVSAGSSLTVAGPMTLTFPSGNSLQISAAWTLTLRAAEAQF